MAEARVEPADVYNAIALLDLILEKLGEVPMLAPAINWIRAVTSRRSTQLSVRVRATLIALREVRREIEELEITGPVDPRHPRMVYFRTQQDRLTEVLLKELL
jgi:hypothetical protein